MPCTSCTTSPCRTGLRGLFTTSWCLGKMRRCQAWCPQTHSSLGGTRALDCQQTVGPAATTHAHLIEPALCGTKAQFHFTSF